jgi:hypothetical protein
MSDPRVVSSTYSSIPAYKYLRLTDRILTYAELGDKPLSEIKAKVRLFNPTGIGTWHIAAYDPDTQIAWGVAEVHEREVGSFSMAELVAYRGQFGLPIERDLSWRPMSIAAVIGITTEREGLG